MVVLCAAVVSRSGRILLGRTFCELTRGRLESLLSAFPKLVGPDVSHTFVETDSVRYVYQPMESLYVLLVTNKASNMLEDLETLRLLSKLLPDYCGGSTEEQVAAHVFELTFAVDELVTHGGYREHVTLAQIKTFTEMDSHEEKLQRIITESKINQARDEARRKAQDIDQQKAQMRAAMAAAGGGGGGGKYSSYGSESMRGGDRYGPPSSMSASSSATSRDLESPPAPRATSPTAAASKPKAKGMQLSKAKKSDEFFAQLNKEDNKLAASAKPAAAAAGASTAAAAASSASSLLNGKSVRVLLDEKLVAEVDKEGGVRRVELKGEVKLTVVDPSDARLIVRTTGLSERDGWKCRLHPKIHKTLWSSEGTLGLADSGKPFPVGSDNAPVVLKWRKDAGEDDLPLSLNVWPSVEDGRTVVSVEYSAERMPERVRLGRVQISIPMAGAREAPDVTSCDQGECKFDSQRRALVWRIPEIGPDNASGSMELSLPEMDSDELFPIHVAFESRGAILSPLQVLDVVRVEGDQPIEYDVESVCSVEKFTVE